MSEISDYLNQHRVPFGMPGILARYGSEPMDGFNGMFRFVVDTKRIRCIASDGMGWEHVSVSIEDEPTKCPSWQIMCKVKDLFWSDKDWVVQFHPAKSEYVNNHPGCLHLWRPTDAKMPTPDSIMVGIK